MNVLLSIKPRYIEEIIKGNKRYEFRKSIFCKPVDKIWIYASRPTKKIVGSFEIKRVVKDTPENLWNTLNHHAGIDEEDFFEYFANSRFGFAIEIKNFSPLKIPIDPRVFSTTFTPPQSFYYVLDQFPQE